MIEKEISDRNSYIKLSSLRPQEALMALISHRPSTDATLQLRIAWLFELINWIRNPKQKPAQQMQHFLDTLDQNIRWKIQTARLLRSIVRDARGLELFIQTGMPQSDSLGGEIVARLKEKFSLRAPDEQELHFIFSENIRKPEDIEWLELLDQETLSRIVSLFYFWVAHEEKDWNSLVQDAEKALLLLTLQFQGLGLSSEIRTRFSEADFLKLPFYDLPNIVRSFLAEKNPQKKLDLQKEIETRLYQSKLALDDVHQHLNKNGVSIAIVFKMERLECLKNRMEDLLDLLKVSSSNPNALSEFVGNLITENIRRTSILSLLSQNFSLLAKKIVERNGETGEHYITRTVPEHVGMVRQAIGGGVLTAFTTLVKFLITKMALAPWATGFLAAANYSVSFLLIHFCHFTLGTKQPAMTATTLASKMDGNLDELVDEVINIIRSQFAAISGNVIAVIPIVIAICLVYQGITHHPLLGEEKAVHTLNEMSILGPTPLYAYFTGILLWISSLFSGWVDNWYVFNRINSTIASNRTLIMAFGVQRAKAFADWTRRHVLGIAANVSLGCFLALIPLYLQSWGLEIEVRHVTLSSGSLTAAVVSLPSLFLSREFWLAVCGVASMGVLNVAVAFGLALIMAVSARNVQAPTRNLIYRAVLLRVLTRPLSLFWPTKKPL